MSELGAVLGQLKQERGRLVSELRQLDQAIRALSKVGVPVRGHGAGGGRRTGRTMSAAARKRIAAAQKARWARFRAGKAKAA
jgi:hypothetical protein